MAWKYAFQTPIRKAKMHMEMPKLILKKLANNKYTEKFWFGLTIRRVIFLYAEISSSKKVFYIGISVDMTNLLIGAAFLLKSSYLTIKGSKN